MFTEEVIKQNERIGLRNVGLSLDHRPRINWVNGGPYHDPDYRWSTTNLLFNPAERFGLHNMATMLGPIHIRDPETSMPYNLNVLDSDSDEVTKRLNTPIGEILHFPSGHRWVNEKVRDFLVLFLSGIGVINGNYNDSLLDIFKKSTFVTKTCKECGFHIYWLDRKQRTAIGSAKCVIGFEFEIKTDNTLGLCTLPGSSHKKNPEFHYLAVGIMDGILVSDVLYDLFVEMFKDCLSEERIGNDTTATVITSKDTDTNTADSNVDTNTETDTETNKNDNDNRNGKKWAVINNQNFVTLSDSAVKATAGQMSQFVEKTYRNDFYLRLSGMMFHSRISEESGSQVIAKMCALTADEESKSRQATLTNTYENGFEGEEIEGAPKLAELIAVKVSGQDVTSASLLLDNLKHIWRMDKKASRQRERLQLVKMSIPEAKRAQSGYIQVRGSIVLQWHPDGRLGDESDVSDVDISDPSL